MADDGKEPKDDPFADDDDDDDEEVGAAEGEEGAAPKGVPMVGDVTLQDGRLFWAGLWADSEADLAAGKGKKFKYGGPEGQTAAALSQMPSGEWHGYFFNPGDEGDTKCKEKGVKLKFDGDKARGGGENQFGEFSLKGSYDASTKKMTLRKAYLYQDDDDDDDEIVDAEPEDVAAEIAGLEGDAEIPIEELRKRMAAFEEEERKMAGAFETEASVLPERESITEGVVLEGEVVAEAPMMEAEPWGEVASEGEVQLGGEFELEGES